MALMAPVEASSDPDRPSSARAWSTMAARSPARGCVEARIDEANSLVRLSWTTESVALLIPWPVRAMTLALALMRSVARIVRASRMPVRPVAASTASSTTALSRCWLPFLSTQATP